METRSTALKEKTKSLLVNEMNDVAGAICEAVNLPEAMLLLDFEKTATANFPSISVLLAGLFSPFLLQISLVTHIVQLSVVLVPFAILCTWALIVDAHHPCEQAIPTIRPWLWTQCGLVYVLIIARSVMVARVRSGQLSLNEQSIKARTRLENSRLRGRTRSSSGTTDASSALSGIVDVRELFVSQLALQQQVLEIEDRERRSVWRHIVGWGTVAWLLLMIWVFALVLGYLWVPGNIVYTAGPSTWHHQVHGGRNGQNFCAAWATVMAARASCFVSVVFLIFNISTTFNWIRDWLVTSQWFRRFVERHAREFDESLLGVPVAQVIVESFVLRSPDDCKATQLGVAQHEGQMLSKDLEVAKKHLAVLENAVKVHDAKIAALQDLERPGDPQNRESKLSSALQLETWQRLGVDAISSARAKVATAEQTRTEMLDDLLKQFANKTEEVRDAGGVREMVASGVERLGEVAGDIGQIVDRSRVRTESLGRESLAEVFGGLSRVLSEPRSQDLQPDSSTAFLGSDAESGLSPSRRGVRSVTFMQGLFGDSSSHENEADARSSSERHTAPVFSGEDCCECGNTFLVDSEFCRKCGKQRPGVQYCTCGNRFMADSKFCRKCGLQREASPQGSPETNRRPEPVSLTGTVASSSTELLVDLPAASLAIGSETAPGGEQGRGGADPI
jgi:hypothetical protein